jgi:hypothetical protein
VCVRGSRRQVAAGHAPENPSQGDHIRYQNFDANSKKLGSRADSDRPDRSLAENVLFRHEPEPEEDEEEEKDEGDGKEDDDDGDNNDGYSE